MCNPQLLHAFSIHHFSIFSPLCAAEMYENQVNSLCVEKVSHPSYDTPKEAKAACYSDAECIGVLDKGCDGKGAFLVCGRTMISNAKILSCVYKKREMHSIPTDFIRSPKGRICRNNNKQVLEVKGGMLLTSPHAGAKNAPDT